MSQTAIRQPLGKDTMRIGQVLVAAATGLVLALGAGAAPARAASCHGGGCTGKSPSAQGCSSDALTMASRFVPDASRQVTIEVRYSAACLAVWARITEDSHHADHITRAYIREYDLNKTYIRGYSKDIGPTKHDSGVTKMYGYTSSRWFRACFKYGPDDTTYCTAYV